MPFYILVSGASLDGNYLPGTRRVYQGGVTSGNSIQVYIGTAAGTTEFGGNDIGGTTVFSGSIASGNTSTNMKIYVTTAAAGKVPKGSPATAYTNTFSIQLYTGSLLAGSGTIQTGVVGNLLVSVSSSTTNTFTMTLGASSVTFGAALMSGYSYNTSTTMKITAPASFSVSVNSANLGDLVCTDGDSFAYHLFIDGTEKSLTGGLVQLIKNGASASGTTYTLGFTTDILDFPLGGNYSDTLTLMFTTQ